MGTELGNVLVEIHRYNPWIVGSVTFSACVFVITMLIFPYIFDPVFVWTGEFWGKSIATAAVAFLPVYIGKVGNRWLAPSAHNKLRDRGTLGLVVPFGIEL